jgi:hypothetical protein
VPLYEADRRPIPEHDRGRAEELARLCAIVEGSPEQPAPTSEETAEEWAGRWHKHLEHSICARDSLEVTRRSLVPLWISSKNNPAMGSTASSAAR